MRDGQVKSRTYNPGTETRGWEFFTEKNMRGNAERVAVEAAEHAAAKPVGTGLKDLILMPSHSALTIHEIVAHPTEVDRIVGYEANYAGTSFVKIEDMGKLRYGSKLMNIYADRTHPGGASTVGYDDDGVEAQRWPLVREGVLVGLQTNRETAHYIGETSSRGCTFANHWRNYPFLRMPNVQMEPGPAGSPTVDQMIADVKDGVLVDGQGSFSIDQQRYNGQFARRRVLGDQERQEDPDGDGFHLQRHHHGLLRQPRRVGPAGDRGNTTAWAATRRGSRCNRTGRRTARRRCCCGGSWSAPPTRNFERAL